MLKLSFFLFTIIACCSFASQGRADLLLNYAFDGSVDTSSDTNADSVASTFVFDASLTGNSFSAPSPGFSTNVPTGGGTNSRFTRTYVTANNQAAAVAANDFAQFSLTANAGFALNLTSFDMALGSAGVNANGNGDPLTPNTASFALRSSLDSFATTIGTLSVTAPNGNTVWTTGAVSLTAPAFQNLSSITFRLYMFDSFDTTSPSNFTGVNRMDNIALNGTITAVPEPTSLLLASSLIASGLAFRKRRQSKSIANCG
jgi:hypothetical protein